MTAYVGAAVKLAATDARRQLIEASARLGISPEKLRIKDKRSWRAGGAR